MVWKRTLLDVWFSRLDGGYIAILPSHLLPRVGQSLLWPKVPREFDFPKPSVWAEDHTTAHQTVAASNVPMHICFSLSHSILQSDPKLTPIPTPLPASRLIQYAQNTTSASMPSRSLTKKKWFACVKWTIRITNSDCSSPFNTRSSSTSGVPSRISPIYIWLWTSSPVESCSRF